MNLERDLIALFQWLHQHPELGHEELRTTQKLREILTNEGIEILENDLKTGLIARVRGKGPGRIIGLRCDIDALPIQEETDLPYASQNSGVMHACGHDAHATIMLGAAILLNRTRDQWSGEVKIVFQPAEEKANGALSVVETGQLRDVEQFIGVHTYPFFPAGKLGIKEGPVMAAVDFFTITVRGLGAHAAMPHRGVDPIVASAAIIAGLQTVVSRTVDPFAPAVVSVSHVEAGTTWNILPETAFMEGTVRSFDPAVRDQIRGRMEELIHQIAGAYGTEAEFVWHTGPAAVINDAKLCEIARSVAREEGLEIGVQENGMGGEDFSAYLANCPGIFIRVGTGGEHPTHHCGFTVDTTALYPAAKFFAHMATRLLNEPYDR